MSFKLNTRLQQIENMVTSQYHHIWDCCCDHGLLGAALLSRQNTDEKSANSVTNNTASNIHFVDIVPDLMAELEQKLQRFYPALNANDSARWQTHCLDVTKLPLSKYQGKQLVIIAGVGGDLMIEFIEAIHQQHKNLTIDFLLCPVHHQYSLRSKLIELDFSLKDEVLVEENRRFYEILLVSSTRGTGNKVHRKISPVGDKIWPSTSNTLSSQQIEIANKYLNKTLNHYQRMMLGFQKDTPSQKANEVQQIIDAYRGVIL